MPIMFDAFLNPKRTILNWTCKFPLGQTFRPEMVKWLPKHGMIPLIPVRPESKTRLSFPLELLIIQGNNNE